jgi:hypothetical protein
VLLSLGPEMAEQVMYFTVWYELSHIYREMYIYIYNYIYT